MSSRRTIGSLSLLFATGLMVIGLSQIDFKTWRPVNRTHAITLVAGACGVYSLAVSLVVICWRREQPSRREDDIRSTRVLLGYLTRHSTGQHVAPAFGRVDKGDASRELSGKSMPGQRPAGS